GAVGNITVLAKGTVSLTSGSDYGTYTRIGHTQNPSGNITVSGADSATGLDVTLTGGSFGGTPNSSTAAIGHGGFDLPTVSDYSGNISLLNLRSLSLNATSSPVRIGHSNDFNSATAVAMGNVSGNILITGVTAGMSVTINGSTTAGTGYAQIGHGAHRNGAAQTSGIISLSNVSSLSLTGEDAQGQIGHGGKSYNHANGRPAGLLSGDITITGLSSGMTVSMIASPASGGKEGYVMIGNGGYETDSTSISGTISLLNLGGPSALTMQGGQAMAQIGHGGEISSQLDASGSLSGKITINGATGAMGIVMINAAGPHNILIGHGGHQANAYRINGDIELTDVLNIDMEGFEQGAVQIGHGGFQFNNGLTGTRTITGGITITGRTSGAGIFMGPGSEAASYVQIGHGGFEGVLTSIDSAPIQMTSISLIDMFGGGSTSGSYSMIGHGGTRFNYQATGATSRSITNSAIGISGRADGAEIIVTGGTATDGFGFAQIGHGGFQSWFSDITTGSDITMSNVSSLTLKGRQGYAQAGHGGKYFNSSSGSATTLGVANINAGITITGLTSAGGMVVALSTFASGSTSSLSAYAQIGNGGYGAIVASMLNSTINISNVAILSMADNRSYVQIGHGGESFNANTPFAAGTIQGGITIAGRNTTGMVVDLNNASSDSSMLQIGHGGTRARISALTTANIDLTNASSLTATGVSGFIQIGHGGRFFNVAPLTAGSALSGNISISGLAIPGFAMNLTNDTATLTDADIQIGHGGYLSSVGDITSANIALTNITSLDLTANMAPVQIGHGGRQYNNVAGALGTGGISGFILIQGRSPINGATVNLRSNGNFDIATAHIGHGGPSAYFASITLADIDLSSISALSLVGNYGAAQVGHGGFSVFQGGYASNSVTGNITITGVTTGLGMTVSLSDQGNGGGYSQIGHGGHFTKIDSISSANISVLNVNILNLFAGSAYSQIGHGGLLFNSGTTGNTIQGGITIRGVPGGSGMFVTISTSAPTGIYAQIGHGGVSAESTVISLADIEMSIAKSIQVNAGESVAQIGHSVQGSGMTGKITLQGNGLTVRVAAIDANAQIGHGYYGMTGTGTYVVGGDILIDAPGGSLTIKGGQANGAYAQVGHGGISATSVPGNINLSGNIWIKTGDVTLTGGSVSGLGSYGMIGNGGTNVDRYSNISGQISIAATGETSIITLGTGASTFPWIGNRSGLLSTVGGNILLQTHTLDNAATTSLYSAVDLTMGLFMGNDLAHGDFTLLTDTDLSAGSIIGNGPGILSLLSKGNVGLFPQIRNTSNGDLYVAAGFDGTSGIFGDPSAVLVNQSFFLRPSLVAADIILVPGSSTSFSHNINLVAGKSINILSGAVISSGNTFLAITDNLNAVRPAVDTTATFTNSGSIVAPTIRIFAADPGTSTVGTLPGLPQKRGIWYGDSGALLNGVNFKTAVAVIPPPPVIPPVPPVDPVIPPVDPIPPIDPTPPIIPPIIIDPAPRLTMDASDLNTAVDTSDDILARRYGKFLTYTISYAPAPHSTNRDSILFMSSYSVFSRFTSLNSAAGPAAP
ncbi:MAG TPA: hypothetical protein VK970_14105, partial [Candidatus Methylacidiphilales bacterium]|nr:hypothetical protein [Candidatus Methylacidiphilales bacterium]